MKYHDPNLFNYMQKNDVTPELYATPWFITIFASNIIINQPFKINYH
jgi:hypothetical protein